MLLLTIVFIFTIPLEFNTVIHQQSFAQISSSPERLSPTSPPPFQELPQQQKAASTNKTLYTNTFLNRSRRYTSTD